MAPRRLPGTLQGSKKMKIHPIRDLSQTLKCTKNVSWHELGPEQWFRSISWIVLHEISARVFFTRTCAKQHRISTIQLQMRAPDASVHTFKTDFGFRCDGTGPWVWGPETEKLISSGRARLIFTVAFLSFCSKCFVSSSNCACNLWAA